MTKTLDINKAPFLRTSRTSRAIMIDVCIALLPVIIMSIVHFGIISLVMLVTGALTAVAFEYGYQKLMKKEITVGDCSALVTGLLLALSLAPTVPIWVVVFGTFVAIILVKQIGGGIGKNPLNPAVFARVLIKILFTPWITNWVLPGVDAVSTATPLSYIGNGVSVIPENAQSFYDLFMGNIGGNIGETTKWAILLGCAYLVLRKVISIKTPIFTIVGLFLTMMLFGKSDVNYALYHVLSGTFIFAAVFMVTDYTSGPLNSRAKIYYALLIGIITGILRYTLDLPGGVGVAILIMNIFAPLLDAWCTPRVFGQKHKEIIVNSLRNIV